jgi:hypothetical protein
LQKVIIILIVGLVFSSCSIKRKSISKTAEIPITGNLLTDVKNQNLTNFDFFIQKGEVEYITESGKEKYLFTVKYKNPGRYLVSIKNRAGIEGVRIFVSGDTIMANDRINKVLYSASSLYLQQNFGISPGLLPLIFGDIILGNREVKTEKCIGNKVNFESSIRGQPLLYEIDCEKRKLTMAEQEGNNLQIATEIRYDQFFSIGGISIPKYIEMHHNQTNTTIKIKILKIEIPWSGNIDFVPGRDYEKMELL